MIEITFSLLALLGQDVTMISVLSLQMAAAGYLETLLGSGLGLHFRHFTISFKGIKLLYLFLFLLAFSFKPSAISYQLISFPAYSLRLIAYSFYFFVDLGAIIICMRLPSNLGIISTFPNSSNSCANFSNMISPCSL